MLKAGGAGRRFQALVLDLAWALPRGAAVMVLCGRHAGSRPGVWNCGKALSLLVPPHFTAVCLSARRRGSDRAESEYTDKLQHYTSGHSEYPPPPPPCKLGGADPSSPCTPTHHFTATEGVILPHLLRCSPSSSHVSLCPALRSCHLRGLRGPSMGSGV